MTEPLREIVVELDADTGAADRKLGKVDKTVNDLSSTLGALAQAFIGSALVHGIREFVTGQIELGSRVNDLSERLGVGTDELQSFQFAAGLAGVGAEEAAKGLQFLNKNLGEALAGNKEAAATFASLGIAIKDGTDVRELNDILPEIADSFAAMGSDAERTATAMKIFGKAGAGLIPLLKGGSEQLVKMNQEFIDLGGGMSKDFVKAADEVGDELDKVKFGFNSWKSQIAFAILPLVLRMAHRLQDWVKILIKVTKETRLAQVAWIALGSAGAAAGIKAAAGFAKVLGVLPKDASVWKTLLGLGEIGLVIIAVAALVLIFEDLYTMLTGGESVIGEVLDGLFGIGTTQEVIKQVNAAIADTVATFMTLKPIVDEFWTLMKELWPSLIPLIKAVGEVILGSLGLSLKIVASMIRVVAMQFGALFGNVGRIGSMIAEATGSESLGKISSAFTNSGDGMFGAAFAKPTSAEVPMPLHTSARTGEIPKVEQRNSFDITVMGGATNGETGRAVKDAVVEGMDRQMGDALAAVAAGG